MLPPKCSLVKSSLAGFWFGWLGGWLFGEGSGWYLPNVDYIPLELHVMILGGRKDG